MTTLQWAVLGLAGLNIFITARYAVLPTLRELHEGEQKRAKPIKNFFYGDDPDYPEFDRVIEGAREINALGVSLAFLAEHYKDNLKKRVKEDEFRLTGVIVHPALIESNGGNVRELGELWGFEKDELLEKIKNTIRVFKELRALADEKGKSNKVKLWGLKSIPHLGITVINPGELDAIIRVTPYITYKPGVKHPVIFVRRDENGMEFETLYATYKRIRSSSLSEQIV